jgi:hypothetical protein
MPMDENEKKELVKKIMDQRRAIWKSEPMSERPKKHSQSGQEESTHNIADSNTSEQTISANPVDVSAANNQFTEFILPTKKSVWRSLFGELKKSNDLGWKTIFFVIIVLVGAITIGILFGYLISTTGLMRKFRL